MLDCLRANAQTDNDNDVLVCLRSNANAQADNEDSGSRR